MGKVYYIRIPVVLLTLFFLTIEAHIETEEVGNSQRAVSVPIGCHDAYCYCDTRCLNAAGCADITLDVQRMKNSMEFITRTFTNTSCAYNEGCVTGTGNRKLLRFDTVTPNIGRQALHLGSPYGAAFYWDDCHMHWHLSGYASYRVLDSRNSSIGVSSKQAFCLLDSIIWNASMADAGGHTCSNQGIGRGWADIYPKEVDCQWIDVTDVRGGSYTLRVELNPPGPTGCRSFIEENYVNNIFYIPFTIESTGACDSCPGFYKRSSSSSLSSYRYEDPVLNSHTVQSLGDDSTISVNIDFQFPFYCEHYQRIYVNANGFVSMQSISGVTYNPLTKPEQCWPLGICALWDDWNPSAKGKVYTKSYNNKFIVTWYQVVAYGGSLVNDLVTFQLQLLSTGDIIFIYPDVTTNKTSINKGASATVGIQSTSANDNLILSYRAPNLRDGEVIPVEIAKSRKPIANGGGPYYGRVGQTITLIGSRSYDPDGDRIEYNWNFGDQSEAPSNVMNPTHAYASAGTYRIYLFVSDFPECAPGQMSDYYWTTVTITN